MAETIHTLQARIGRAFLEILFDQPDIEFKSLHLLFGEDGSLDSLLEYLVDQGDVWELMVEVIRHSDLDDEQFIKASREVLAKRLADILGAKSVEIAW